MGILSGESSASVSLMSVFFICSLTLIFTCKKLMAFATGCLRDSEGHSYKMIFN